MPSTPPVRPQGSGCLTLFGLLFAIPGALVAVSAARKLIAGPMDAKQIALQFTAALIFIVVGAGLAIFGRVSTKAAAKKHDTIARNPEKPWLWRDDWSQGYASAEWRSTANTMTVIGLMLLLFSVPMFLNFSTAILQQHPFETVLVLVFPLCGVYLLGQSAVGYLRSRKFQEMRLVFSSVPCAIGGKLAGRVEARFLFPPGTNLDVTLNCVRSYVSGSGDSQTRWERILWQEASTFLVTTDGRASFIPVEFTIPYDGRETDARNPDDEILWKVRAQCKLRGLDFNALFHAPVFKTAASDPALTSAAIEAREEDRGGVQPLDSKIVTRSVGSGILFYFGAARNKGVAAMMTLFGLVFLGGGLFFGIVAGKTFSWILGAIPLTFSGGIGLLLTGFGLWLFLGTTTIEVADRELHIRSSWLGISRSRVIPGSTIRDLQLNSSMQFGEQVFYELKLTLANGRSVVAGGGMQKKEAEWLRSEIKKDLGIA